MNIQKRLNYTKFAIIALIFAFSWDLLWKRSYKHAGIPSGFLENHKSLVNKRETDEIDGICEPKDLIKGTEIVAVDIANNKSIDHIIQNDALSNLLRATNKPQLIKVKATNNSKINLITTNARYPTYLSYKWQDENSKEKEDGRRTPIRNGELKAKESIVQNMIILNGKKNMARNYVLNLQFVTEGCTWHKNFKSG